MVVVVMVVVVVVLMMLDVVYYVMYKTVQLTLGASTPSLQSSR